MYFFFILSAYCGGNPAEKLNCLPNFQLLMIGEMNPVLKFQLMEFWNVYDSCCQVFKIPLSA